MAIADEITLEAVERDVKGMTIQQQIEATMKNLGLGMAPGNHSAGYELGFAITKEAYLKMGIPFGWVPCGDFLHRAKVNEVSGNVIVSAPSQ